jgi:hypothetical protein
VCPRCGYLTTESGSWTRSDERAIDESGSIHVKGQPVPNPIGVKFTASQARKLQRTIPPHSSTLQSITEHGRFRALRLWGTPQKGSLDPALSESLRFEGVTSNLLKQEFERAAKPLGFELAQPFTFGSDPDISITTKRRSHGEGTEVTGWFYAERELRADKAETRRRGRRKWLGAIGGLIPGVVLLYFTFTLPFPYGFLALPAGVCLGVALVSLLAFANSDYWSDVIVARVMAELATPTKSAQAKGIPAEYVVQYWVVRSLSQDWASKAGSGRTVIAGVDYPGLDSVRRALRDSLTSQSLR